MNKIFQALFVLLVVFFSLCPFLVAHTEVTEDSWTTKTSMPTATTPRVAVVYGKIYAIVSNVNYEYDPVTGTWATKKPMPTPRMSFGLAVHQNRIYAIGGVNANGETGVNEVYDPLTDTWETKTSMPTKRCQLCANVVNGKIYLIGGLLPTDAASGSTEVYDPTTDSWTTKASIPAAVYSYASAVVDNKIYVIGGSRSTVATPNLNQIYDPETNNWTIGNPILTPVTDAAAGATTGVWAPKRIYVIGGRINYSTSGTDINQVYNPENDTWTFGASMPTPRYSLGVAVVNDMLYAIGGVPRFMVFPSNTENEQYTPFGYGTVPPTIYIVSPENKTYDMKHIHLDFIVSEPTSWIGYSLDGQANVTITGNTTLTGLSEGSYSLTVYAKDTTGNTGASETIYFSIERFPTTLVVAAVAIVLAIIVSLAFYRRRKRTI